MDRRPKTALVGRRFAGKLDSGASMSDGREERQEQEQRRQWENQKDREDRLDRNFDRDPADSWRPERRES